MIRFRRIFDLASEADEQRFAQVVGLFKTAFAGEPEGIEQIERVIRERKRVGFDPVLLIATNRRRQVSGFAFAYYFPEIQFAYLQYIASDLATPARGIGTALYEALREVLAAKGARGLLLDVPPAESGKLKDPGRLQTNRARMRFYARYDVQKVAGTRWDEDPNPRNEGYLTTLLYDPLGHRPRLGRSDARRTVRWILTEQYGFEPDDAFVEGIVQSFRDDPVRLEPLARQPVPAQPSRGKYLTPIKLVAAERHVIHHLRERGYVERPVRVRQILRGLERLAVERVPARHFPDEHVTAVHDVHLVDYLKAMSRRLDEKAIIYPEVFPIRRPDRIPKALEDRAGYYCADTFTPLTKNVWPAARHSVDVALTAAGLVVDGERFAYALCRPPGHHAERRIYGGFCFLNNAAIAAHYLSRRGKVALLDIDYHHGNGAQDIFYSRRDVLTLSIHGHPSHAYPNFSGYADERGEGEGLGFNRNWPLDPPMSDDRYLAVLEEAIDVVAKFQPRYLVVALGFDIMRGDPTGSFALTARGMERIGRRLGRMRLPTLIVQEGGYAVGNLRVGSHAFFEGLQASWF
jgi:acetoin utilization deacetylase AcuC-like enzyme